MVDTDYKNWFQTLPGVFTSSATLIVALTGVYAVYRDMPKSPIVHVDPNPALPTVPSSLTRALDGPIGEKWVKLAAASGPLGEVKSRQSVAVQDGIYMEFMHGFIYWRPSLGAVAIYGAIAEKWSEMGHFKVFGYPRTDEKEAAKGGRYNDFETGNSIYYHPTFGTHAMIGGIGMRWKEVGRETGACGYPKTDEYDEFGNGKFQRADFEFGYIRWSGESNNLEVSCNKSLARANP
jgi:uncharacterized protein with LGFP repeats